MNTKNSFLFIGGVKDGMMMCVEGQRVDFPVLEESPPTYTPTHCDIMRIVPFRTERYIAQRLRGNTTDYIVYVLESMDADEAIEALIRNYSVEKKK